MVPEGLDVGPHAEAQPLLQFVVVGEIVAVDARGGVPGGAEAGMDLAAVEVQRRHIDDGEQALDVEVLVDEGAAAALVAHLLEAKQAVDGEKLRDADVAAQLGFAEQVREASVIGPRTQDIIDLEQAFEGASGGDNAARAYFRGRRDGHEVGRRAPRELVVLFLILELGLRGCGEEREKQDEGEEAARHAGSLSRQPGLRGLEELMKVVEHEIRVLQLVDLVGPAHHARRLEG